jgi:hypothetical protein
MRSGARTPRLLRVSPPGIMADAPSGPARIILRTIERHARGDPHGAGARHHRRAGSRRVVIVPRPPDKEEME